MLNLIIDIGNSQTKIAVFKDSEIIFLESYKDFGENEYDQLILTFTIKSVILSNTGKIEEKLLARLKTNSYFIHLSHLTVLPITNQYDTPETLGMDRIAAAVGACFNFPGRHCLIVDMGTCITMDFVDAKSCFLGGNISPGIFMRLRALHEFTAALPLIKPDTPGKMFGSSTYEAIQNGAVRGAFLEIEAFIKQVRDNYRDINVILTGGEAHLFERYTKNEIFVLPNLVLFGLNEILKYNAD